MENVKILGLSGSLRKGSFSTLLLNASVKLAPEGVQFDVADISQIPMFNQDDEANLPAAVAEFKAKIEAADALVIVTPEYNYSFPGVLKNTIDWATRPYGKNSFTGKPTVIMSQSPGPFGGIRAWYHLQQVAIGMGVVMQNTPQIIVTAVHEKFDAQGILTDEATQKYVAASLTGLVDLVKMMAKQ
jgi:chromate reductase